TLAFDRLDRLPTVDEMLVALSQTLPEDQREAPRRVFVPPRPRGHGELLGRLQAVQSSERIALLAGPPGSGKSLLLRELKWRLQIRGVQVLEVAGASGDMVALLSSLCRQLEVALGPDARAASARRAFSAIVEGRVDGTAFSDALAEALGALSGRGPVVLLIDDLDHAQAAVGAVLRSALFAEAARAVALIATAADAAAPAVRKLAPSASLEVPALSAEDQRALATDALGPVDISVLEALTAHTQGLPAALMDALASLFELAAPTVADVRRLPSAGAGLALAHARLGRVPAGAQGLLRLLAVLGRSATVDWLRSAYEALQARREPTPVAEPAQSLEAALAQCERAGLISRRSDGIALADSALEQALLATLGHDGARALAAALLVSGASAGLPLPLRARLAVIAEDVERLRELVPKAGDQLVAIGAHAAAAELYDALVRCSEGALQQSAQLSLARCLQASGELERAAKLGSDMLGADALAGDVRVDVTLVVAQALTELGRFDDAVATLSSMPPSERSATARVQRELARVHLRRGDYDALLLAAEAGLACADDDIVRSELLCRRGMVAAYRADHEAAREFLEEAVTLARRGGSPRDEANALANLAIARFRTGDPQTARDSFAQCLEIARRLGDIGSMAIFSQNLGGILFSLGEAAAAAEHYESAVALASRAGRSLTGLQALNNLAQVHLYFGLYENARLELTQVIAQAKASGHKYLEAQATSLTAELAVRTSDLELALILYDDAIA
ncbi:MAG TPA: ATP-binding protein, partial [Polyangiales bacterium]|nr:ATP-binding protein [Polyangiales bacterium]